MHINNWFEFFLYTIYTAGVIFVLIPMSVKLTINTIRYILKNGFVAYHKTKRKRLFGDTPQQTLFIGLTGLGLSIWYLFIDRGGNLFMYYKEIPKFLNLN